MPAVTFGVSTNFALANFLASRSFGNVSVALAIECFRRGTSRDTSNETYHVPWDLLYQIPEAVTLVGGYPNQHLSDSTWRTMEVCHAYTASG